MLCLLCEADRRAAHERACTVEDCPLCVAIYYGESFCTLVPATPWEAPVTRACEATDYEVEPECEHCRDWLDAHCAPGWGACRAHGYLKMHAHRYRTKCVVPYRGAPCELAEKVWHFRPERGQAGPVHAHCPVCAAEPALYWGEALCPGCRKLITADQAARLAPWTRAAA